MSEQTKSNVLSNLVIIFAIIAFLIATSYLIAEVTSAKKFCTDLGGNYSVSIIKDKHFCNGEQIIQLNLRGKIFWEFISNADAIINASRARKAINIEPKEYNLSRFFGN